METNYKIILKEDFEKHIKTPDGMVEIIHKYKDAKMEINIFILKKGGNFYLKPPKKQSGMKSYFIETGLLYSMVTKEYYPPGSLIVLNYQDDLFNITAREDTYLLAHSFQEGAFENTESSFRFIYDILVQIQRKDAYTHDHSLRVYELVRKLAEYLNYSGAALQNLLRSAKYHDIGKVFIPDEILNKIQPLTEEEFSVMKRHVSEGKSLILEYFNAETYEIIKQHHERMDGSGYPEGLRANEIRQEAKILAICDSFDAMTTDRVYKKGKTTEAAVQELRSLAGKKYDGPLVELFIDMISKEEKETCLEKPFIPGKY